MKKNKVKKWSLVIGVILLCVIAILAITFTIMYQVGKYQLNHTTYASTEGETLTDRISYKNHSYQRKEGLITLLGMGVDIRQEDIDSGSKRSGQSDAVILAVLDPKNHDLEVISVPRDIMIEGVIDPDTGETQQMQLTLQYAYGDGGIGSCQLVENAVSSMFFNQPINAYGAINMLALPQLNDAVGGVTVTVQGDYTALNPAFTDGATLLLQGDMATDYVHCRDITVPASSYDRNSRHRQYIEAYKQALSMACRKNVFLPFRLMKILQQNMTSNLTTPELLYLGVQILQCDLTDANMHVIDVTITKEGYYEQYYIDQASFEELMVDIYYKEEE